MGRLHALVGREMCLVVAAVSEDPGGEHAGPANSCHRGGVPFPCGCKILPGASGGWRTLVKGGDRLCPTRKPPKGYQVALINKKSPRMDLIKRFCNKTREKIVTPAGARARAASHQDTELYLEARG